MLFKSRKPNPCSPSQRTGNRFERLAEDFLIKKGLSPVERNYRCKLGEIDLIMTDNKQLVFVEVRYRKNTFFGLPQETVTHTKQKKLVRAAEHYLMRHFSTQAPSCRFDVVAISGANHANQQENPIEWLPDAFQLM